MKQKEEPDVDFSPAAAPKVKKEVPETTGNRARAVPGPPKRRRESWVRSKFHFYLRESFNLPWNSVKDCHFLTSN